MRIGFVGLGKLGLPCGLAMEQKGHEVFGVDPAPSTRLALTNRKMHTIEEGADEALATSNIRLVGYPELVEQAELIFVAVQTPHGPAYEGATPIPDSRADFDYAYLVAAIERIALEIKLQCAVRDVIIISTVLPGTVEKYIRPIVARHELAGRLCLAYNPYFIAMGTAMQDFLFPEFTLLGVDHPDTAEKAIEFYQTIHTAPVFTTTVENAELIKVCYNTFISTKIAIANTIMEICHKTPNTHCDVIHSALSLATDRIISPKYLRGGMGDGGACHCRDNIAMSWLARKLDLSHDLFDNIMMARENQTRWLADLITTKHLENEGLLPVVILGEAFKPNTNISTGSPARLLSHILRHERHVKHMVYDPHTDANHKMEYRPAIFFVATQHDCWKELAFHPGSTIIDPFRYLEGNASLAACEYIPIGKGVTT